MLLFSFSVTDAPVFLLILMELESFFHIFVNVPWHILFPDQLILYIPIYYTSCYLSADSLTNLKEVQWEITSWCLSPGLSWSYRSEGGRRNRPGQRWLHRKGFLRFTHILWPLQNSARAKNFTPLMKFETFT